LLAACVLRALPSSGSMRHNIYWFKYFFHGLNKGVSHAASKIYFRLHHHRIVKSIIAPSSERYSVLFSAYGLSQINKPVIRSLTKGVSHSSLWLDEQ
jgi:hypothetical protein